MTYLHAIAHNPQRPPWKSTSATRWFCRSTIRLLTVGRRLLSFCLSLPLRLLPVLLFGGSGCLKRSVALAHFPYHLLLVAPTLFSTHAHSYLGMTLFILSRSVRCMAPNCHPPSYPTLPMTSTKTFSKHRARLRCFCCHRNCIFVSCKRRTSPNGCGESSS
jgi:hypothetical protein